MRTYYAIPRTEIGTVTDLQVIKNAITTALNPLKTYQQAQGKLQSKELGQSIKELFGLLENKPPNYTLKAREWKKSKINNSVFQRLDIQDALSSRDSVLALRPELAEELLEVENLKLSKAHSYFTKKGDDSWKFRKFIAYDLDWPGFEARYYDVVTKLLVADPGIAKEARHYLAIYLFTGDSQEYKYRSLMDNALKNQEERKAQSATTQATETMMQATETMKATLGASTPTLKGGATVTVTVKKSQQYIQRCPPGTSDAVPFSGSWLNALLLPVVLLFLTIIL